jgi:myo-inositol-1(or 4)-monophosphatase
MWTNYLLFTVGLAKECGELIRPFAGNAGKRSEKTKTDFATEMDLEAERFIIERIQNQYPDHRIYSEEIGSIGDSSDFEWVIDPIDGTVNYSLGLPLYGISIALAYRDETVVSAITIPVSGETYWVTKGGGAFHDGDPIGVREVDSQEAFVSFPDFSKVGNHKSNMHRMAALSSIINDVYRVRMIGSAAISLAYIAAGKLDAALYVRPNRYDVLAGELLLQEAGGVKMEKEGYTVYGSKKAAHGITNLLPVL